MREIRFAVSAARPSGIENINCQDGTDADEYRLQQMRKMDLRISDAGKSLADSIYDKQAIDIGPIFPSLRSLDQSER